MMMDRTVGPGRERDREIRVGMLLLMMGKGVSRFVINTPHQGKMLTTEESGGEPKRTLNYQGNLPLTQYL